MNAIGNVRQTLETKGWVQGASVSYTTGAVCIASALADTCWPGKYTWNESYQAIVAAIRTLFPERAPEDPHAMGIISFNDHPDTTYEDVTLVLKHAEYHLA